MKVKCVKNLASDIPKKINPDLVLGISDPSRERRFPLVIGKEYVVYGITIRLDDAWYYICDEDFTYYPVWAPAFLFEITNSKIPEDWRAGYHSYGGAGDESYFIVSFREWVDDPYFYDKLTDREAEQVGIFERYRKLMECE
ncbi:MAG: hypothetical protein JSR61_08535 [Proteobacteria bacterium]|nr:hypothetical protein [Pseudomonadota bacterium]